MENVLNFLKPVLINLVNLFSIIYGDVYQGYYLNDKDFEYKFIKANNFEYYLFLFPSFINHLYAKLYSNIYLFKRNDQLFLNTRIPKEIKILPPILNMKYNETDMKELVCNFHSNIPLKFIFIYYDLLVNYSYDFNIRYLSGGIKNLSLKYDEIKDKSLENILS